MLINYKPQFKQLEIMPIPLSRSSVQGHCCTLDLGRRQQLTGTFPTPLLNRKLVLCPHGDTFMPRVRNHLVTDNLS